MPNKLKVFSGADVVKIFNHFGFQTISQKGSHIKLRRLKADGVKQIIIIPNHDELDKGTLKAIYNKAVSFIPEDELKDYFR